MSARGRRVGADGEGHAVARAFVYMLRCRDGSLYTGWTVDVGRRLAAHRAGVASRYTRSRLPVELAACFEMADAGAARREEARIKRLPRGAKVALAATAGGVGGPGKGPAPHGVRGAG